MKQKRGMRDLRGERDAQGSLRVARGYFGAHVRLVHHHPPPLPRVVQLGEGVQAVRPLEGGQGPRGEPPTAMKDATSHSFASTALSRSDALCRPTNIVQPGGAGVPSR